MNILFLDIDGVLNHRGTTQRVNGCYGIDPSRVSKLNDLCAKADFNIVISSTWRRHFSTKEIAELIEDAGFAFSDRIIGATPVLCEGRGSEILEWIDHNPGVELFVALDDDVFDMYNIADNVVQTTFDNGLTDQHVNECLSMFGVTA